MANGGAMCCAAVKVAWKGLGVPQIVVLIRRFHAQTAGIVK